MVIARPDCIAVAITNLKIVDRYRQRRDCNASRRRALIVPSAFVIGATSIHDFAESFQPVKSRSLN
jgi:hypothetical protein